MNLRTFGQLKAEIARVCGVSGMAVTDPRVMEKTNLAVEELLNEGDFPWTVERLIFRVYCGNIVLPTAFDRVMSMSVDGVPQQINSPWYEMTSFSGWDWNWSNIGHGWWNDGFTLDRDEVFQFRDIPRDQVYILSVSTQLPEEEGATILFKSYDSALSPITTLVSGEWIEGQRIALSQAPVLGSQPTSQIYGIVKPVTRGEVYVYAIGQSDGARVHIGTYAPKDTSPFYRSYKIVGSWLDGCGCVLARCRRRYSPVTNDDDLVLCGNIPALKKMVQAVWYGDAGEPEKYAQYKAIAVDILKKEAMAYRGKSRVPAITFTRGFGLGSVPSVR